jgi:hypothetical protein
MDYSLNVKRQRMQAVLNAIDGGNGPGIIELRDSERVILCTLLLQRPSFYLVGENLQLCAPTTGFVSIAGVASIGTISDGSGIIVVDEMTVGIDTTPDQIHDYEIVLDDNVLDVGKQVTITNATLEHG